MGRFKLDQNLHAVVAAPLAESGHDVSTAAAEHLDGAPDDRLAAACRDENRCLVTADLDFAQVLQYPPGLYPGLVVLRHPKPTLRGMRELIAQLARLVKTENPAGRLWIIEPGRVRVHEPSAEGQ